MKVSGAVAMADDVEAFGLTEADFKKKLLIINAARDDLIEDEEAERVARSSAVDPFRPGFWRN